MATFSTNQEAKMKKQVKGVLNTCKEVLKNAPNNGCVIKNIDKKLASL